MELYHGMIKDADSNNEVTLDSLPPSSIMRLLYEVRMRFLLVMAATITNFKNYFYFNAPPINTLEPVKYVCMIIGIVGNPIDTIQLRRFLY